MDKNLEKLEENQERARVCEGDRRILTIECTSTRAPKKRIERTCVHAQKKEIDHRAIDRSPMAIEGTCV